MQEPSSTRVAPPSAYRGRRVSFSIPARPLSLPSALWDPFSLLDNEDLTDILASVPDLTRLITDVSDIAAGKGARGDIHTGQYKGKKVALKTMRSPYRAKKHFTREIVAWRQLRHPNILELYGICRLENHGYAMVSPWMYHGDLVHYLRADPDADRASLILDIAMGLEYLHGLDHGVVHGDLRASNVLVGRNKRACIADFGISRVGLDEFENETSSEMYSVTQGNQRWMSPERIAPEAHGLTPPQSFTPASDVYGFGMTMYEVYTGQVPFYDFDRWHIATKVVAGARPTIPEGEALGRRLDDNMWGIAEDCWNEDPAKRPTAEELVVRIRLVMALSDHDGYALADVENPIPQDSRRSEASIQPVRRKVVDPNHRPAHPPVQDAARLVPPTKNDVAHTDGHPAGGKIQRSSAMLWDDAARPTPHSRPSPVVQQPTRPLDQTHVQAPLAAPHKAARAKNPPIEGVAEKKMPPTAYREVHLNQHIHGPQNGVVAPLKHLEPPHLYQENDVHQHEILPRKPSQQLRPAPVLSPGTADRIPDQHRESHHHPRAPGSHLPHMRTHPATHQQPSQPSAPRPPAPPLQQAPVYDHHAASPPNHVPPKPAAPSGKKPAWYEQWFPWLFNGQPRKGSEHIAMVSRAHE